MSKKALSKLHDYITQEKPTEQQLTKFVKDLAYLNEPTDRTISVRYSQFKKHIRDTHPEYSDKFLKELNPPTEMTKKIITENKQRKLDRKMVKFDDSLIDKILSLQNSDNPYEQAIYLQFISGRRINEVYSAPLRINNKQPLEVAMKLSKKNGDDKAKYHKFNLLQNTIQNKDFKQKLNKLRSSVNGVSLQDFTNRVNRKVKQIIDKDLSSHDLRGLYSVYGFHTQNDDDTNLLGYINKVLNHGDTSIDSSQSYSNFKYIK
jgi:hypothetical protein